MRPWLRLLRRESAAKVHPAASSALPISIAALSKVCPWLLCIVMAYRIWRGSCWRESCQSLDSHSNVSGGTSTQFGLQLRNGGPAEWSKSTSTAMGKCGGLWSVGTATGELYQQHHYKDQLAAKCCVRSWLRLVESYVVQPFVRFSNVGISVHDHCGRSLVCRFDDDVSVLIACFSSWLRLCLSQVLLVSFQMSSFTAWM